MLIRFGLNDCYGGGIMKLERTLAYRLVTAGALGAAALGVVLPVMPTTPFVLIAAWSASRHSPELEARLLEHPHFGPHLLAWRRERALSRRAKVLALAMLAFSLILTLLTVDALVVKLVVAAVVCAAGGFLVSRPEPEAS